MGENKAIITAAHRVDFKVVLTESEDELLDLLLTGKVDAAVRGSLSASHLMAKLRESYPEVYRASLLEYEGHQFLLAPVGIDEGDTLKQKSKIVKYSAQFLEQMGLTPKIGIISGGRPQDKGRSVKIDTSICEGKSYQDHKIKYGFKHLLYIDRKMPC